ncbi:hypothetical protein [Flagellimonas sp.]|uniref:hypothetical protein n=1 Tax=Flagellimonas sp. TaxID=2058762 RepID=UPI0034B0534F
MPPPTLFMAVIPGGPNGSKDYVLRILNIQNPEKYKFDFAGASETEQYANMELFAQSMEDGVDVLRSKLFDLVEIDKENWPEWDASDFIQLFFNETEQLVYQTTIVAGEVGGIVDIEEGESVLDVLTAAGEALLTLL